MVVAVPGVSGRAATQVADILLCSARSRREGVLLAAGLLERYPGCAVTAVAHRSGAWCLLRARDMPPLLAVDENDGWCSCAARLAAEILYAVLIEGRRR